MLMIKNKWQKVCVFIYLFIYLFDHPFINRILAKAKWPIDYANYLIDI
jgi:hypothetical protein